LTANLPFGYFKRVEGNKVIVELALKIEAAFEGMLVFKWLCCRPGFELSKSKWGGGVDICLLIVIVITHRRFSIINNGGRLKLTPRVYQSILFGGLSKQLGGSIPNAPAIQTLL
jgi:hypothetical protein